MATANGRENGFLQSMGEQTGAKVLIYRFPNLFGKWSRPNYNGVIATFCHNISRGLPIQINDPDAEICFAYIDDVMEEMLAALEGGEHREGAYCTVPVTETVKLGRVAALLQSFLSQQGEFGGSRSEGCLYS